MLPDTPSISLGELQDRRSQVLSGHACVFEKETGGDVESPFTAGMRGVTGSRSTRASCRPPAMLWLKQACSSALNHDGWTRPTASPAVGRTGRLCGSEDPGRTDRCVNVTAGPLTRIVSSSVMYLLERPGRFAYAPIAAQSRRRPEGGASAPQGSTRLWPSSHQAASSSAKSADPPATAGCTKRSS